MLNVPEELKQYLESDEVRKNFRVHFPNGESRDIVSSDLEEESPNFADSICSERYLKFGLCEDSQLTFETHGIGNLKGAKCEVSYDIPTPFTFSLLSSDDFSITTKSNDWTITVTNLKPLYDLMNWYLEFVVHLQDAQPTSTSRMSFTISYTKFYRDGTKTVKSETFTINNTSPNLLTIRTNTIKNVNETFDNLEKIEIQITRTSYTTTYKNFKYDINNFIMRVSDDAIKWIDELDSQCFSIPIGTFVVKSCKKQQDMSRRNFELISQNFGRNLTFSPAHIRYLAYNAWSGAASYLPVIKSSFLKKQLKARNKDFLHPVEYYSFKHTSSLVPGVNMTIEGYRYTLDPTNNYYSDIRSSNAKMFPIDYSSGSSMYDSIITGKIENFADYYNDCMNMKNIILKQVSSMSGFSIEQLNEIDIFRDTDVQTDCENNGLNYLNLLSYITTPISSIMPSYVYCYDYNYREYTVYEKKFEGSTLSTDYGVVTNIKTPRSRWTPYYIDDAYYLAPIPFEVETEILENSEFQFTSHMHGSWTVTDSEKGPWTGKAFASICMLVLPKSYTVTLEDYVHKVTKTFTFSNHDLNPRFNIESTLLYNEKNTEVTATDFQIKRDDIIKQTYQNISYRKSNEYWDRTNITETTVTSYITNAETVLSIEPSEMVNSALELEGKFGVIDRFNRFKEVDVLQNFKDVNGGVLEPSNYERLWYDDFPSKLIGRITCTYTNTQGDTAYKNKDLYSDYTKKKYTWYSLAGNYFIQNKEFVAEQIGTILDNFAERVRGISYIPWEVTAKGNLLVDCGDFISIHTDDGDYIGFVENRILEGIDHLVDTYRSESDDLEETELRQSSNYNSESETLYINT